MYYHFFAFDLFVFICDAIFKSKTQPIEGQRFLKFSQSILCDCALVTHAAIDTIRPANITPLRSANGIMQVPSAWNGSKGGGGTRNRASPSSRFRTRALRDFSAVHERLSVCEKYTFYTSTKLCLTFACGQYFSS